MEVMKFGWMVRPGGRVGGLSGFVMDLLVMEMGIVVFLVTFGFDVLGGEVLVDEK